MKQRLLTFLLAVSVGLLSWGSAQGTRQEPFDLKKTQQELQIMKGILNTTLGFVANELRSREASPSNEKENTLGRIYEREWGGAHITAYYLYGQGANFLIPISSLRMSFSTRANTLLAEAGDLENLEYHVRTSLADGLEQANLELEAAEMAVEAQREHIEAAVDRETAQARREVEKAIAGPVGAGASTGVGAGVSQAKVTPQPAPQPAAPAVARPPRPPRPPRAAQTPEEMRKKLAEVQEKVKKRRAEMEFRQQKLLQSLAEVKVYLIEALANHGDSITTVKPNEYINIIFTTDEGFAFYGEDSISRGTRQVMSVQKSWVSDYKAGRITMEAFKQKVLHYSS